LKEYIAEYKSTHWCVVCGERDPVVLQFDHVRGVKEGNVADMVRRSVGLQRLKNEIDKCDVLCANDHFRRHHNDRLLRGVEKSGISVGP
jgi:hypothetical protein